jgi:hypothetical protein
VKRRLGSRRMRRANQLGAVRVQSPWQVNPRGLYEKRAADRGSGGLVDNSEAVEKDEPGVRRVY